MNLNITKTDALIIVDPQNDFCPGGALAVPGGDEIMIGINNLAQQFAEAGAPIVLTQDWHPEGHKSFASAHGQDPFTTTELAYGEQVLWPDHCVQSTKGAAFHMDIVHGALGLANVIIRKGMNLGVDSYSAFYENDKTTSTGLGGYLKALGVQHVYVVGLAYDYCVAYTAIDAMDREYLRATVIKDLTRAIAEDSTAKAEAEFAVSGVKVI